MIVKEPKKFLLIFIFVDYGGKLDCGLGKH